LYGQVKGSGAIYRKKEDRVRRLLRWLSLPARGFSSGLEAVEYDLGFCYPVKAGLLLHRAVLAAYDTFVQQCPPGRWVLLPKAFSVSCGETTNYSACEGHVDGWYESGPIHNVAGNPSCVFNVVMAAPTGCRDAQGVIGDRFVPMDQVFEDQEGHLVPTEWMLRLLDCLDPGWSERSMGVKRAPAFLKRTTVKTSAQRAEKRAAELAEQEQAALLAAAEHETQMRQKRRTIVALTSSVVAGGGALMIARNLKRKRGR
jgi:hypothetical protein